MVSRDYFIRLSDASWPLNAPLEQKAEWRQDPEEFSYDYSRMLGVRYYERL
jgi:hypothetical protein